MKTQAERNALRHDADLRAQVEWFKRNLFGQGKRDLRCFTDSLKV